MITGASEVDTFPSPFSIEAPAGGKEMYPPWALAREWSVGEGPEVVADAKGVPGAIQAGIEMAASAGRVVIMGMSHHDVPLRVFSSRGVMSTQEFPLERAPEALRRFMEHPAEAMEVVIGEIN